MTRIPSQLPNSDDSSRVPAERWKVRRRSHQAASAALVGAQNYGGVGLPVIPLAPGGKRPVTPHRADDATTDVGQMGQWWTQWPTVSHLCTCTEVGDRIRGAHTGASVLISGGAS